MEPTPPPVAAPGVPPSERLVSLDALRGFDMMWIAGADGLGEALRQFGGGPLSRAFGRQLEHVPWEGLHLYDLVFPGFIFIMGVAIPFSLTRMLEVSGRPATERRIYRRAAILFVLGILYYGGLSHPISDVRWLGVLQRFGLCYLAAALLFLNFSTRALIGACAGLLVGYWVLLRFLPVPGLGAGQFAEGQNLTNWLDKMFLPGRKWDGDHDPEGYLSTLPAIASCLLGVLSGIWLRMERTPPAMKAVLLAAAGALLYSFGHLWGIHFPVIKKIWTSSFVLEAGGISATALAVFYLVIDVWKVRAWATPFVWVGANALTIYLLCNVVEFGPLARRFVGGSVESALDKVRVGLGGLVAAILSIGLCFAVARFLYRRKIFLRL
jgi:predicted acyltransferase